MNTKKLQGTEDQLHEAAIQIAGFEDFGDPTYLQGLRVLLRAFDTDLQLTETGLQVAYNRILRRLAARLFVQKGWAAHPEVLTTPIRRPVVVLGMPRTGTTALHKMLSVDPQFQGIEFWLLDSPCIRPPRETWETHPVYRACVSNINGLYARQPELRKVHELVVDEAEECTGLLMQSFITTIWSNFNLPTYDRWVVTQDTQRGYARYANTLRLIGARETTKRWLLKSPYHMAEIEALFDVFPDACVIHTHRDPLKTIPSLCNLRYLVGREFEGEAVQRSDIGPRQCTYWRKALERTQQACQRFPKQFFHVDHRSLLADPLRTLHSIYEYFNLTLTPQADDNMRAWVAASPTTKHGEHTYPLDSWGISPAEICETFADYRAQHCFD